MQRINKEVEFAVLMQLIEEKLSMDGEVNILATGNSMYPLFRHKRDQVIAKVRSFCRNGRQASCEDMSYRLYVQIWTHTVRLRRAAARGKSLLRRLF